MRAILIVCSPKECADILNGNQTILIRKICPKQLRGDTPIKPEPIDVYIYCTKDGYLHLENNGEWSYSRNQKYTYIRTGKVVANFTLNKVEEIYWKQDLSNPYVSDNYNLGTDTLNEWELRNKSCLESEELEDYLGFDDSEFKALGYAWHISNLQILEKPRELDYFTKRDCSQCPYNHEDMDGDECIGCIIEKAPAVYCYVEI